MGECKCRYGCDGGVLWAGKGKEGRGSFGVDPSGEGVDPNDTRV